MTLGFLAATAGTRCLALAAARACDRDRERHIRHAHRTDAGARQSGPHRIVRERAAAAGRRQCRAAAAHSSVAGRAHRRRGPAARRFRRARELRTELIDFYTSRGFRLFGGAYSQYANTFNAIANLLNFAAREVNHPYLTHESADDAAWDLKRLAYFSMLQQRGYRLHVYQSTYMDLCHADGVQPQDCTDVSRGESRLASGTGAARRRRKSRAIANALVTQSRMLRVLNKVYERVVRASLLRAWCGTCRAGDGRAAELRPAARTRTCSSG